MLKFFGLPPSRVVIPSVPNYPASRITPFYLRAFVVVNDNKPASTFCLLVQGCDVLYGNLKVSTDCSAKIYVEISSVTFDGAKSNTYHSAVNIHSNNYESWELALCNSSITLYNFGIDVRGESSVPAEINNMSVLIIDTKIFDNSQGGRILNINQATIEHSAIFQNDNYGLLLYGLNNATFQKLRVHDNEIGIACINCNLTMNETVLENNDIGIIVMREPWSTITFTHVLLNNCSFTLNTLVGVLISFNQDKPILRDCTFSANSGSSIVAYQSSFELFGEAVFSGNTAERGAGLALYNSTVHFGFASNITFVNNTAKEYGGAIYISSLPPLLPAILTAAENTVNNSLFRIFHDATISNQKCFYSSEKDRDQTKAVFTDNNALMGGRDIFGPTSISYTDQWQCQITKSKLFNFANYSQSTGLQSQVASDPSRVCFCSEDIPQCENRTYLIQNETRYPGESFTISVVLVGFNFGRVAGTIYTDTLDNHTGSISDSQHAQLIKADFYSHCTDLNFTIFSGQTNMQTVLALTAQHQSLKEMGNKQVEASLREIYSPACDLTKYNPDPSCTAFFTTPVYINITLIKCCPLGFQLDVSVGVCVCDNNLNGTVRACEIRNHAGNIIREGTVWVGVDTSENKPDIYYWHRYCPRDYCIPSQTSIELTSPDKQCSSNRSGVLCGGCKPGYSLQLGVNKCAECNNSYLALLIVFALLGILLVALIKLLDLTVTSGTISGLIFYANVVWRNNAILFSLQDRQNIGYYIITVPIAWINLDFGIETCFGQSLDQLTKTALQFVFPVYIWCIAGLIIVISHYSTRATRLFGNNSAAVLATLFLLSYGKLFRNITDVFTFADMHDSNNTLRKVWSLDGNIEYGITPGHVGLIVLALLFSILFLLPFTLTLLLVPFLRAKSHLRPLHWINTLKPFFDTYYGPFKDKKQHQVWTGILLISRVVILIVFASTSTHSPNANILLMIIISTSLVIYNTFAGLPYKKWYLSTLEILNLFNLIILGSAFFFYQSLPPEKHQQLSPMPATSVCVALFQLICTLIFHLIKQAGLIRNYQNGYRPIENGTSSKKARKKSSRLTVTKQVIEISNGDEEVDDLPTVRESLLS